MLYDARLLQMILISISTYLQWAGIGSTGNNQKITQTRVITMSLFERTKHCTHKIPCRLKLSLMICTAVILVSVITVPIISAS